MIPTGLTCFCVLVQVGIFQVIYLNRSAEEAYKPIMPFKPFVPFRDASCGVSTFHLTVFDVVKVSMLHAQLPHEAKPDDAQP